MSNSITNIILLAIIFEWYSIGRCAWQVINNPITKISQIIYWVIRKRLITMKWSNDWIILIIYIIGWYLGVSLYNWFNCSRYGWILELILVTMLLAYKNMFCHVTKIIDRLYNTDLELCKYKLSGIVSRTVKNLNEHEICNSLLLSLVENISDGILLPAFYYLIGGLPGLTLYKTSDLIDSIIGNFKLSNKKLSLPVCQADSIVSAFPCFILLLILNLIKTTNAININDIFNSQRWNTHSLILKLASWFNIKIWTGGKYGKQRIINKQLNNSNYLPNGLDIIRLKRILCSFITIFMIFIIISKRLSFI